MTQRGPYVWMSLTSRWRVLPQVQVVHCQAYLVPPQIQQRDERWLPHCFRGMARWSPLPNPRERARWETLELSSLAKDLDFFNPTHVTISLSFYFPLIMDFNYLIAFCFLAISADKRQVTPRLNLTNVAALYYLLHSEIFVSEDR